MNSFIANILSLKGTQLDSLIEVLLILLFIGAYIIPLVVLINDLKKRYDDKFLRFILTGLAILGLPLFIIPYILFRKETTISEDISIDSELNILTTTNNCIKCNKCSEINRSDYNYCIKCGNLLIALCKNCSQNIDLNWFHCGFCGVSLKTLPQLLENKIENKAQAENDKQIEPKVEVIEQIKPIKIVSKIEELDKLKAFGSTLIKNKKIIYVIGHKLNSLITPTTEVYKQ